MNIRQRARVGALLVAVLAAAIGVSGGIASASTAASHATKSHAATLKPKRGGSLTVTTTLGSWLTFDPISSATTADLEEMVFGSLFQSGVGGTTIPDLATKAVFDPKDMGITIYLRHGVQFSDGEPFNAAAVAQNWNRDLLASNGCPCAATFNFVSGVTAEGNYEVHATFKTPYAPFLSTMLGTALEYIVAPNNLAQGTAYFGQHPIGAGAYTLQSQTVDVTATLVRNPNYWDKPEPYLNQVTYQFIGADQANFSALQSGASQIAEYVSTPSILAQAKPKSSGLMLVPVAADGWHMLYFDDYAGVMTNLKAREAVEYATNDKAIDKAVYAGTAAPIEELSTPTDLYYHATIPNFRSYNPKMARKLVQELGGSLNVTLVTGNVVVSQLTSEAMIQEWAAVGIHANLVIATQGVTQYLHYVNAHQYDMVFTTAAATNPDPSVSLINYITCGGLISFVCDPTITQDLALAHGLVSPALRSQVMTRLLQYINDQAYVDPITADSSYLIVNQKVQDSDPTEFTIPNYEGMWLK